MNERVHADVVVAGGGISGLVTAFLLEQRGQDVLVLEKNGGFGGKIRSHRTDGFLVEAGPNAALETTPLLSELIRALGQEKDKVYADEKARNRFVVRGGALVPLPASLPAFIGTQLFSWRAKLRLFGEPFVGRPAPDSEETVAEFVNRRLGGEFLDYAINPFVAGIYAGDPRSLSVRAAFPKLHDLERRYGGLIAGTLLGALERWRRSEKSAQYAHMFSFTEGMGTLPAALANRLARKECGVAMTRVARSAAGGFELTGETAMGGKTYTCRCLVVATPAQEAATLVRSLAPQLNAPLNAIPYPPVAVVVCAYKRRDVTHPLDGFGFLVPEKEKRDILGTIFTSTLFPGRAPEGYVLLTSFVGGMRSPDSALLPEETLTAVVERELNALLRCPPRADFIHITQWKRAIPQYTRGHLERMAAVEQAEADHPGLFFCANYRGGISVGDCVKSAHRTAERVAAHLAPTKR